MWHFIKCFFHVKFDEGPVFLPSRKSPIQEKQEVYFVLSFKPSPMLLTFPWALFSLLLLLLALYTGLNVSWKVNSIIHLKNPSLIFKILTVLSFFISFYSLIKVCHQIQVAGRLEVMTLHNRKNVSGNKSPVLSFFKV